MPSLEKKLKPKAKNIETSPSLISQNYVHAVFRCVCCGRKFGDVDYRQEDMVKMLKFDAPLCKKCAKFLKGWQQKFESKLGKVTQKINKTIEDTKVDMLAMFCYQGPPTKHWIETKGQFWMGWNECCNKILENLQGLLVENSKEKPK